MKLLLDTTQLLEASNYRGFLKVLYETNKKSNADFSYAYMAKQCRFSSKSFLKEVIEGKKKLSLESAHKIVGGLPLPALWGKYFLQLVVSDEKIQTGENNSAKELHRLRGKLLEKQPQHQSQGKGSELFKLSQWPYVYAALGSSDKGATLMDIESRTGLGTASIAGILSLLMQENMVTQKGRRYFANSDTAFFEKLGKSQFFKNYYSQSVGLLFDRARKNFDSEESLFYSMALSVKPEKMPQLKKDLAELLDKYTADIESPEGARVASLTCGFHLI